MRRKPFVPQLFGKLTASLNQPDYRMEVPFFIRSSEEIRPLDKPLRNNDGCHMTIQAKVRKIGNSLGIVLPKEALQALKVGEGDVLYLTEGAECSLRVTPERPGFLEKMQTAESLMNRYRNAFRELAK
jgi:putative addiction module antidote